MEKRSSQEEKPESSKTGDGRDLLVKHPSDVMKSSQDESSFATAVPPREEYPLGSEKSAKRSTDNQIISSLDASADKELQADSSTTADLKYEEVRAQEGLLAETLASPNSDITLFASSNVLDLSAGDEEDMEERLEEESGTRESGSSVYVTATEHTPRSSATSTSRGQDSSSKKYESAEDYYDDDDDEDEDDDRKESTTSEEYDVVPLEPKLDDLAVFTAVGSGLFTRRTLSGELSTVSEISEEASQKDAGEYESQPSSPSSPDLPTTGPFLPSKSVVSAALPPQLFAQHKRVSDNLLHRPESVQEVVEEELEEYDADDKYGTLKAKKRVRRTSKGDKKNGSGSSSSSPDKDHETTAKKKDKYHGFPPARHDTSDSNGAEPTKSKDQHEGQKEEDADSTSGSFMVGQKEGMSSSSSSISLPEEPAAAVSLEPWIARRTSEKEEEETEEDGSRTRSSRTTEAATASSNREDDEEESLDSFRKQDISRTEIESQVQQQQESSSFLDKMQQDKSHSQGEEQASSSKSSSEKKKQERLESYEPMMMEEEEAEEEPGGPDIESSQATERDFAKSEFSLEQQDSQDIDEESLSGLASQTTLASAAAATSSSVPQVFSTTSGPSSLPPPAPSSLPFMIRKQTSLDEKNVRLTSSFVTTAAKPVVPSKAHLMQELDVRRLHHQVQASTQRRKEFFASQSQDVPSVSSLTAPSTRSGLTSTVSSTDVQTYPYQLLPSYTSSSSTMTSFLTESSKAPQQHLPVITSSKLQAPSLSPTASETETSTEVTAQTASIKTTPAVQSVTIDITYKSTVPSTIVLEEEDSGVNTEGYDCQSWLYINRKAEYDVWIQRLTQPPSSDQSNDSDLTEAEKSFKKQFSSLTHRMIHRKACLEMFRRVFNNTFRVDKTVTVKKNNGEFGFRIHGSKPVVVSAIEKSTAAEASGLEVGDVIITLNEINVLESSHSEVVKLAHSGPPVLKIDLLRTISCLGPATAQEMLPFGTTCLMSGFLMYKTPTKMNSWKKRWFSFNSDNILYWHAKVDDPELLGVLKLKGCRVHLENQPDPGIITRIITIRHRASNSILLSLQTASTELAVQWIEGLTKTIVDPAIDPYMIVTSTQWSKVAASAIIDPDCIGHLGKFSHVNKIWRQRYFVLKDACLVMYENASSSQPLGIIYLHGYKAQSCSMVGKKNTFEVVSSQKNLKHFWFMAESEAVKKR